MSLTAVKGQATAVPGGHRCPHYELLFVSGTYDEGQIPREEATGSDFLPSGRNYTEQGVA
jgi:hypothetical protein